MSRAAFAWPLIRCQWRSLPRRTPPFTSTPPTLLRLRPTTWAPAASAVSDPRAQSRCIHLEPFLMPPVYFTGLLGALWLWKCLMLVVFQNKIIYMPGMPPNARRETIADYASQCGGVQWEVRRTRAFDGIDLALAVASVSSQSRTGRSEILSGEKGGKDGHVYILYFQGLVPRKHV